MSDEGGLREKGFSKGREEAKDMKEKRGSYL